MSAITSNLLSIDVRQRVVHPAGGRRTRSREDEFRAALDRYMVQYADTQKRRAEIIDAAAECATDIARRRVAAWFRDQIGIR